MKLFFIVFLIIIIATLSYVSWHVWHVLPLPRWQRWTVVGILIAAFCTAFLNLGVTDRLPMSLATWCYETGWSMFIVMLYLCIIFLVLDLGRLCHLVPREWLHDNPWTSGAIAVLLTGVLIYGNLNYKHKELLSLPVWATMSISAATPKHCDFSRRQVYNCFATVPCKLGPLPS